jgi:ABC-2 type transport system permease protein
VGDHAASSESVTAGAAARVVADVGGAVTDVLTQLLARTWRKALRRPVLFSFSFVQPIWWMLLFGALFQRALSPELLAGRDYRSFVAPGVSLLTVLFGASQAGISLLRDAQTGMLARMLHTPTPALAQLLGKLLADLSRFLLMALCVLGIGAGLGANLTPDISRLAPALLAIVAFGVLFSALSCAVAALAREPELMGAYVHLINMPLLFTSTALVPGRALPGWLSWLAQCNPMSIAAEAWRALWLGTEPPSAAALSALVGAALAMFLAASLTLARARIAR